MFGNCKHPPHPEIQRLMPKPGVHKIRCPEALPMICIVFVPGYGSPVANEAPRSYGGRVSDRQHVTAHNGCFDTPTEMPPETLCAPPADHRTLRPCIPVCNLCVHLCAAAPARNLRVWKAVRQPRHPGHYWEAAPQRASASPPPRHQLGFSPRSCAGIARVQFVRRAWSVVSGIIPVSRDIFR